MTISVALANSMLAGYPSPLDARLHVGDPGADGSANAAAGVADVSVALAAASGGQRAPAAPFDFLAVPPGTYTHLSLRSAGAFQRSVQLQAPAVMSGTGVLRITSLLLTMAEGAAGGAQTFTESRAEAAVARESAAAAAVLAGDVREAGAGKDSVSDAVVGAVQTAAPWIESITPEPVTVGGVLTLSILAAQPGTASEAPADAARAGEASSSPVVGAAAPAERALGPESVTAPRVGAESRAEAASGPGSVTDSVTGGAGPVSITDDFNRADGALGTGWTGVGTTALRVVSNRLAAPANDTDGVSLRDEVPAANQYAEIEVVTLPFQVNAGIGVRVRGQAGTNNGYTAVMGYGDDGEGGPLARIDIRLNGTPIIEDFPADFTGWNVLRLEVVGNALTVKTAASHGGTYTTRISTTNGTYAAGRVGVYANAASVRGDNFYGGDL